MVKIEVAHINDRLHGPSFIVEATFREPFEHFFEIARHNAHFADRRDADRLAERVREALREDRKVNGYRSESFVIGREHWTYRSSAYTDRMGTDGATYRVAPSRRAQNADQFVNQAT